jgi:hypothetical protein
MILLKNNLPFFWQCPLDFLKLKVVLRRVFCR